MGITKEQLAELVGDSALSEDALIKIKVMVENAINEKVEAARAELMEQIEAYEQYAMSEVEDLTESNEVELADLSEKANAYADYVVQEMTEKVDAYSEYVVEQFLEENHGALVQTDEYNKMKRVFDTVKESFETAGFVLNESAPLQVNPDEELVSKLDEAKVSFNELFEQYQAAIAENEEMHFAIVFEHLTKDLASTQVEKVKALVENVSFDGVHEFKRAVELMIEQITDTKAPIKEDIEQVIQESGQDEGSVTASEMSKYLKFL